MARKRQSQPAEKLWDEQDATDLFDYLKSQQGHELASRIITLIEEVKKTTLDKNVEHSRINMELEHKHRRNYLIVLTIVVAATVISATFLTYFGKFDSPIGVLFGTLVGYFFGRRAR